MSSPTSNQDQVKPPSSPDDINGMHSFNEAMIADFRANGGVLTLEPFAGHPLLLLHTIGAKSGAERISPLAFNTEGDDLVIIASMGGAPKNPAWYHNLVANPDTTIELGTETVHVHAEIFTDGPEHRRLYDAMAEKYPQFHDYQANTDRVIPVVVLRRR